MSFESLTEHSTASYIVKTTDGTEHNFNVGATVEVNRAGVLHVADAEVFTGRNFYLAPGYWQAVEVTVNT